VAARRRIGLDSDEVSEIRRRLDDGGKPRVTVVAPQFGDVTAATVIRIGDPARDGADFIRVRLKVNGITDELGFAPEELQLPGRRATAASPAKRRAAKPTPTPKPTPTHEPTPPRPTPPRPVAFRARQARAVAPPTVTITIKSSGSAADLAWTATVTRGARAVLRGAVIPPGAVGRIAELVGSDPAVAAVEEVNSIALAVAQQRAERLRAELADLDAVLATHHQPR
jgi:hypothetical protein